MENTDLGLELFWSVYVCRRLSAKMEDSISNLGSAGIVNVYRLCSGL